MGEAFFEVILSSIKMKSNKTYRDHQLSMIVSIICALLNSQGGVLNIKFEEDLAAVRNEDGILRAIEQRLIDIWGSCLFKSKVKTLGRSNLGRQMQVISVQPSPLLCTVNYNLYLPTQTQVVPVASWESHEKVKNILSREVPPSAVSRPKTESYQFILGTVVSFPDSDSRQFKHLKAEKSKCVSLADRMTNKSNKLSLYISAFCNKNGGEIFYGIGDDGMIIGETINEKDRDEIERKVRKIFSKVFWLNGKMERGKHWNITFHSIKDGDQKNIPSLFVIVIAVSPLAGGVFIQQPESYYIEQGLVKSLPTEQWKDAFLQKDDFLLQQTPNCFRWSFSNAHSSAKALKSMDPEQFKYRFFPEDFSLLHKTPGRVRWSSVKAQKIFYLISQNLLKFENDSNHRDFRKISRLIEKKYPEEKLIILGVKTEYAYRTGRLKRAKDLVSKYEKALSTLGKITDEDIMRLRLVYLKSEIARTEGKFQQSYNIAKQGEYLAQLVPAGIMISCFYQHVAFVEGVLSLNKNAFEKSALVHSLNSHYLLATDHVGASNVEQQFTDAVSDIKQRILIYHTVTTLGEFSHGDNFCKVTSTEIKDAERRLSICAQLVVEGASQTKFRRVSYLLAMSDLRLCQWLQQRRGEETSSLVCEVPFLLKASYKTAKDASDLSRKNHFEELLDFANSRLAKLTEIMVRLSCAQRVSRCLSKPKD